MSDRVADLPDGPLQVVIMGRKGTGKTELARVLWDSWPGDRLIIDVNGDVIDPAQAPPDDPVIGLEEGFAGSWPEHRRAEPDRDGRTARMTVRYVPDHLVDKATYHEELDRAVGVAFSHPGTLLWVDEIGEVAPVHQVGPHMRRALHMGRHQELYIVTTGPRPMGIDPLVLAQADVVYVFDLPNPDDQRRVADAIGWDRRELAEEIANLEHHGYLRYIGREHELSVWPPLPLARRRRRRLAEEHFAQPGDGEV